MRWPFIAKTKERLQIDPVECGAVSLGIVLNYFGAHYDSRTLKEATRVSKDGANALSLIEGAKSFGLSAKAEKRLLSEIKKGPVPAILFFDNGHFVVYEGYFNKKFFINDPGLGRLKLTDEEMAKRYSHVFIELKRNEHFKKTAIATSTSHLIEASICAIAGALCAPLFASSAQSFASLITTALDKEPLTAISILSGCSAIIIALIFSIGELVKTNYAMKKATHHVQNVQSMLKNTGSLFFLERPRSLYEDYFSHLFSSSFKAIITHLNNAFYSGLIIGLFFVSAYICEKFAGIFVVTALIFFLILRLFSLKKHPHLDILSLRHQRLHAPINDLKEMGQKEVVMDNILTQYLQIFKPHFSNDALQFFALISLGTLSYFILIFIGILEIERGNLIVNDMIASSILFLIYIYGSSQLKIPTNTWDPLLEELKSFQKQSTPDPATISSLEGGVLSLKKRTPPLVPPQGGNGRSFFERFAVSDTDKIIAVVATDPKDTHTFFERFWVSDTENDTGKVYCLGDDTPLAYATLYENVSLKAPFVTTSMVIDALKNACLEDFFHKRPEGLHAVVDDQGHNLSQGQKKRLLLARALCHDANVIALKDFFQFLDEETSLRIINNLRKINKNTFFIPYRASECSLAHRVILIHEGVIVAIATHEKLMLHNPLYQKIFETEKKDGGAYETHR